MITKEISDKYEITVGIECHVQLDTISKLFSGADNNARDRSPNSVVSPVDYALPGMLPALNRRAVDLAIIAAKALNSSVAKVSRFDRKHYFYPDLPKGYQISQMYQPIIGAGIVHIAREDGTSFDVRIEHAHLEEDAGKLTHIGGHSLVDLNRAGTPLIEIVSMPDIHSALDAKLFVTELHYLMTYAGVTQGDLYQGNMRFDVNVSVAKKGAKKLGLRSEMKNLNSFRSVERSVEYEFKRQVELLEAGKTPRQETRGWSDAKQKTFTQRSKENANDYRYMPDADIPPIVLTDAEITKIQKTTPRLPDEWRSILRKVDLDYTQIETLIMAENEHRTQIKILEPLEKTFSDLKKAKHFANWCVNILVPMLNDEKVELNNDIDYFQLESGIYDLLKQNKLSSTNAKKLFRELATLEKLPNIADYATQQGYLQVSDDNAILAIVDDVLEDPVAEKAIKDFKNGNEKVIGFLVGQVMQKSGGKANPAKTQELIRQRLK